MSIQNRRAFVALDMLFGIAIIGSVSVVLISAIRRERAAESQLAESRSALHLAERALLSLQHEQHFPVPSGDMKLTIHPAMGGLAPAGSVWTKVDAVVHGHRRSLFGVVPITALQSTEAKS